MSNPTDPVCNECARNRDLIAKLDERLTALEAEVRGAPLEVVLEEFEASTARRNARRAAIAEYEVLQQEEFYRELPGLKEAAARRRSKYEAFMRERGFEP